MIQRWRTTAITMAAAVVGLAGSAWSIDLAPAVREAADADAQRGVIDAYVKGHFDTIVSGRGTGPARDELGRQADTNSAVTPSASFQAAYVRAVVAKIDTLLTDKTEKGIPSRLNAAIIVGRLSKSTKLNDLAPVAQKLMADPAAAVALWGVKAGADLLPPMMSVELYRTKQATPLIAAILASAKDHADAGPLIQSAYEALALPEQKPALPKEAYKLCIDSMNKLLSQRIAEYATAIPATPQAERIAPVFLVQEGARSAMDGDSKLRIQTVQNLADLLSIAAQQTAVAGGEQRVQTISVVTSYAGSFKVMLTSQNQPVVAAKFDPLTKLRDPIDTAKVVKQVTDALTAIRTLPDYKDLKDSPQVKSGS